MATKLLAFSAAAFWCGYDTAGQVRPGVRMTDAGLTVDHYIYMADFETGGSLDMAAVVQQCEADGAIFSYDPRCDELDEIRLPDLAGPTTVLDEQQPRELALSVRDGLG